MGYVYKHVKESLQAITKENSLTLEIGCGDAQYRTHVNGQYIGIDLPKQDYRRESPNTIDAFADAQQLPFQENTFDYVFFCGSLYLISNPTRALFEARRVLKQGGHLSVFDYNRMTQEKLSPKAKFPFPCWTQYMLRNFIIAQGFHQTNFGFVLSQHAKSNGSVWKWHVRRWLAKWLPSICVILDERREGWAIVHARK